MVAALRRDARVRVRLLLRPETFAGQYFSGLLVGLGYVRVMPRSYLARLGPVQAV